MVRILIADDHDVVRCGLRAILEAHSGWEVVAQASDGMEAIEKAAETQPDIAVLDYSLPLANGGEVTRQIRAKLPKVEVLIFTMHDNDEIVADLLAAGAKGYLLKSDARQLLITAVESLVTHRPFFTGKVSEALLERYLSKHGEARDALSARERSVVQLIAEGNSNKTIAELLTLSLKTVETHRSSAMRKLNLSSTAALVRYAVRNKLVEP
jgi:DNA-binding NarL/FixJ family response regulator